MKRILFSVLLFSICVLASTPSLYAQSRHKVYREIWTRSNCFNTILSMELEGKEEIDLFKIVDENGNKIKFSSTSDAMTYLNKYGWNLESTSTTTYDKDYFISVWVISKEVEKDDQIMDGINLMTRKVQKKTLPAEKQK
jgi:hypothetical protein